MTAETSAEEQVQLSAEEAKHAKITYDLQQVQDRLRRWHTNERSDSVRVQHERAIDFSEAAVTLERLINDAHSEDYQLELSVGEDVVWFGEERGLPTYDIGRGVLDFLDITEAEPLRPGETLTLDRTQSANRITQRVRSVYVGELSRMVELGELAHALGQGAEIGIQFES